MAEAYLPQSAYEAFGERSGGSGGDFSERSASDQVFALSSAVDLVGNIRGMVQQEQASRSKDFNPASWLRKNIDTLFNQVPGDEREKQEFFYTLRAAWDLVAYEQLHGETSSAIYNDINGYTNVFGSKTLVLKPLGVTLLDAMAEALDIPHTPRQDKFDISLFSEEATMERANRRVSLFSSPSLEEVRQAITPTQQ
jgi:hypothetical protein